MVNIEFPPSIGEYWSERYTEPWTFADETELETFVNKAREVMESTLDQYPLNELPSFLSFYRKYLEKDQTVNEFYLNYYHEYDKINLSSVGQTVVFKKALTEKLSGTPLAKISDYIYMASGSECPDTELRSFTEFPISLCPSELLEYVTVVLKFNLDERGGHVIMDVGYGVAIPLVVMEDGGPPQSPSFQRPSLLTMQICWFRHATKHYIIWTSEREGQCIHRIFYLARAFLRPDIPDKYQVLKLIQCVTNYKNGKPLAGHFVRFGGSKVFLEAYDNSTKREPFKKMVTDVVLDGPGLDVQLAKSLELLGGKGKDDLRVFLQCCEDDKFEKELVAAQKCHREKVNAHWVTG